MINMPAFCNNCGFVFNSGFVFENCSNVSLTGIKISCPNCQNSASIPDGFYNFIGNTIELLNGPELTLKRLRELKVIITNLKNNEVSIDQIKSAIKKESPELNSLIGFLPKTRNELYAFIAILLTAISLIINQSARKEGQNITINNIINRYNEAYPKKTKVITNDSIQSEALSDENINSRNLTNKKIGRNEKCPCGSGEKYKKCHGENK